jgi:hypothetical protein
MQVRAKGYPGTRHLQVLQGLGNQGMVSSICAAQMTTPSAADYGYRPVVSSVVERMKLSLPK